MLSFPFGREEPGYIAPCGVVRSDDSGQLFLRGFRPRGQLIGPGWGPDRGDEFFMHRGGVAAPRLFFSYTFRVTWQLLSGACPSLASLRFVCNQIPRPGV